MQYKIEGSQIATHASRSCSKQVLMIYNMFISLIILKLLLHNFSFWDLALYTFILKLNLLAHACIYVNNTNYIFQWTDFEEAL